MRHTPFEDVERLFDQMNRRLGGDLPGFERSLSEFAGWRTVAVDVVERGNEIVLTADLPGFAREDIGLSVDEDVLTIVATRDTEREETDADADFVRRERHTASTRRSVGLPAAVDAAGASATYQNGVLTVTLPVVDAADSGTQIGIE